MIAMYVGSLLLVELIPLKPRSAGLRTQSSTFGSPVCQTIADTRFPSFMNKFSYAPFQGKVRKQNRLSLPPQYYWYQSNSPGGSMTLGCNRQDQTTLTRFFSGHPRSLTYTDGA
ncbi:hypothetical protein TNCT_432921 [Trichonephila clavata]|uniref:Uncharacterized protein n=1 Tax=Trichonephila clavata TaxID=2740835 RepID=A0A8X6GLM8_TRICU|nr:hypothetical protein TNCT_432921 [Trichonephila clavata]